MPWSLSSLSLCLWLCLSLIFDLCLGLSLLSPSHILQFQRSRPIFIFFSLSHLFDTQLLSVIRHCSPSIAVSVGSFLCSGRVLGIYINRSLSRTAILQQSISLCPERLLGTVCSNSTVRFKGTPNKDGFVFLTDFHTTIERDNQPLLYRTGEWVNITSNKTRHPP